MRVSNASRFVRYQEHFHHGTHSMQIGARRGKVQGGGFTWGVRACLSHLNEAVVVFDDVAPLQRFPGLLVTLEEQFVQMYEIKNVWNGPYGSPSQRDAHTSSSFTHCMDRWLQWTHRAFLRTHRRSSSCCWNIWKSVEQRITCVIRV